MKRISPRPAVFPGAIHRVWVLLLVALTPGLAHAWHYVPARYRVQFSPYAFNHRNSGLVPGGLDYSVHAFNHRSSGLVFEGVRYTPYLFTYDKSGLIYDYGYRASYGHPHRVYYSPPVHVPVRCIPVVPQRICDASTPAGQRQIAPGSAPEAAVATTREVRPTDGVQTIRQYLRGRGFARVDIDRIMRIDNNLVSADFFLKDRNLLIKYWNPQEIEQIDTKEGFKQKAYERYMQDWARLAAEHERNGVEVYHVNASDAQTIVAALDSCTTLDVAPDRGIPHTLYARN